MAMNRVQFQAGLSMPEFLELYGTESKCHAALEVARWPGGFKCPACSGPARTTLGRDETLFVMSRTKEATPHQMRTGTTMPMVRCARAWSHWFGSCPGDAKLYSGAA